MKVALYIGSHTKDTPSVRLGWWLTRLVQKGEYANVTHVEAILKEHPDETFTIGSASIRDGGVRIKRCNLSPENWIIVDVPQWSEEKAAEWFVQHEGEPYDTRGAFSSAFPIQWTQKNQWFCNQAVGESVGLKCPEIFGPAQFAAICHSL